MSNPILDLNDIRKRILAGEKFPPEVLRAKIDEIRHERFEKSVAKKEKRVAKGDLSPKEQDKSLDIFDNLP